MYLRFCVFSVLRSVLRSICLRDLLCEYIKIEKSVNREIRITTGLGRQVRGHSAPNLWARKEISKQSQSDSGTFFAEGEKLDFPLRSNSTFDSIRFHIFRVFCVVNLRGRNCPHKYTYGSLVVSTSLSLFLFGNTITVLIRNYFPV